VTFLCAAERFCWRCDDIYVSLPLKATAIWRIQRLLSLNDSTTAVNLARATSSLVLDCSAQHCGDIRSLSDPKCGSLEGCPKPRGFSRRGS